MLLTLLQPVVVVVVAVLVQGQEENLNDLKDETQTVLLGLSETARANRESKPCCPLCCYAAMLLCCSAVMLQCCYAAVLLCCSAVMLQCCYAAVLQCCTAFSLLRWGEMLTQLSKPWIGGVVFQIFCY